MDSKNQFFVEFTRKKVVNEMQEGKSDIYAVFVYIHTHIYIYTICVYRYMCTHIYICITTYSIRCFNTLFSEKTMETETRAREQPQVERKKRRQKRRMFFLGGQPGLWRIFTDVLKKAHPDSLPPGMPLLNPLFLLQVLLPPICKISILYFLNEQGRETPRKGFSASISPQVQR